MNEEVLSETSFTATSGIKLEWEGSSPADGVTVRAKQGTPRVMIIAAVAQLAREYDIPSGPFPFSQGIPILGTNLY
jgi:hypothetical protein